MTTVNPYLLFNGNCEEAFNHYKKIFKREFLQISKYSDMPAVDNALPIPDDKKHWIMHVALPLDNGNIIMGSDRHPTFNNLAFGENCKLSISVDTKDEANRLFDGLSLNGSVEMPMEDTFWGDYFGMCTDQFGVEWMVSFNTSTH
ncbi:VOC family protein [Aegicerativicinus sediminis]|uniref:VOC family protein n=1 Tax=Aegicerativicinus sediminis TaxID=2893202 RepID=UPI001E524175|nr:VOC family protein [Aegicerativicinus sediminis]